VYGVGVRKELRELLVVVDLRGPMKGMNLAPPNLCILYGYNRSQIAFGIALWEAVKWEREREWCCSGFTLSWESGVAPNTHSRPCPTELHPTCYAPFRYRLTHCRSRIIIYDFNKQQKCWRRWNLQTLFWIKRSTADSLKFQCGISPKSLCLSTEVSLLKIVLKFYLNFKILNTMNLRTYSGNSS